MILKGTSQFIRVGTARRRNLPDSFFCAAIFSFSTFSSSSSASNSIIPSFSKFVEYEWISLLPLVIPPGPHRWGFNIAIPWTAAEPPVIKASPTTPTVRGTMATGSNNRFVNEARTLRLIKAGFCEARNLVVPIAGVDDVDVYKSRWGPPCHTKSRTNVPPDPNLCR